jgi:hypothetical protein
MNAPAAMWPNLCKLIDNAISIPMLEQRPPTHYTSHDLRAWADKYAGIIDPKLEDYLRTAAPSNRPDMTTRNGNIALHALIATKGMSAKKHKSARKSALDRIADVWQMKPSYVKEILTTLRSDARRWLENLLDTIDDRSEFATRAEILKALDADLVLRAATMPRVTGRGNNRISISDSN